MYVRRAVRQMSANTLSRPKAALPHAVSRNAIVLEIRRRRSGQRKISLRNPARSVCATIAHIHCTFLFNKFHGKRANIFAVYAVVHNALYVTNAHRVLLLHIIFGIDDVYVGGSHQTRCTPLGNARCTTVYRRNVFMGDHNTRAVCGVTFQKTPTYSRQSTPDRSMASRISPPFRVCGICPEKTHFHSIPHHAETL